MKEISGKLGRTLNGRVQEAGRLAALTTRRQEQSFARLLESMRGGLEFEDQRMLRHPAG